MKYTYNVGENKVVCVSHYAGKPVRGIAKCNEAHDKFNCETGMKLAKMRCDTKIALKRVDYTVKKLNSAIEEMVKVQNDVDALTTFLTKSENDYAQLKKSLEEFEEELAKVQESK